MRRELARVYEDAYEQTCRHDTLDALEVLVRWLRRCERHEGLTFLRSIPQAVRGIEGWQPTGYKKLDHSRFRNSVTRRLDMLERMGVVESWEAVYRANGEGRGILVRLRRDSSVGGAILELASARRPPRRPGPPSPPVPGEGPRRRPSSCTRVSPPLRENTVSRAPTGTKSPSRGISSRLQKGRRARHARGQRCQMASDAVTALRSAAEAGQEKGLDVLGRLPWLAELEPAVLLRAAAAAHGFTDLRLSESSRLMVETAVEQLDRHDGRGAGASAILDLAAGGWRHHVFAGRTGELAAPRTPGALAKPLRQRARLARRAAELREGRL